MYKNRGKEGGWVAKEDQSEEDGEGERIGEYVGIRRGGEKREE